MASSANAQQKPELNANSSQADIDRLKRGFADAINQNIDLKQKLSAADGALVASEKKADDAVKALMLSQAESDALKRAIEAGKLAEDAYKRAYAAEQTAALAYEHRALSAETRVDQLNAKVASANKRTIWGTIGGIAMGILLHNKL